MVDPDGDHRDEQDAAIAHPCLKVGASNVFGDDYGKWVEGGATVADASTDVDDTHGDDRIESQRQAHRHQDRDEGHVFLGHADGRGADREQGYHARDQQEAVVAKGADGCGDQRIDRAGCPDNGDHTAHDEDEEDDLRTGFQSLGNLGQEGVPGQAGCLISRNGFIGSGDDFSAELGLGGLVGKDDLVAVEG